MLVVHSVENEDRPKFKIVSIKPSDGNPNSTLSITLNNVLSRRHRKLFEFQDWVDSKWIYEYGYGIGL